MNATDFDPKEFGRLRPGDVAYLAPQAAGNTWYHYSFMAPMEQNEPGISSALDVLSRLVESLGEEGVDSHRIALLGADQCGVANPGEHLRRRGGRDGADDATVHDPLHTELLHNLRAHRHPPGGVCYLRCGNLILRRRSTSHKNALRSSLGTWR